jgi:hypothetical protein
MKHLTIVCILLAIILTGCGVAPTAQPIIIVITVTPPPPTATATATIAPTDTKTPRPTRTRKPTATRKPTQVKPTKTPKPKFFSGCFTPNGIKGQTAPFKLEAHTAQKVVVYINGLSRNGNHPIYCSYVVRRGLPKILTLMWGKYTYLVHVGDKTTRSGDFFINDSDKATMRVYNDKIQIGPFP